MGYWAGDERDAPANRQLHQSDAAISLPELLRSCYTSTTKHWLFHWKVGSHEHVGVCTVHGRARGFSPDIHEAPRTVVALFLAVILGLVAGALAYKADQKTPAK